MRTKRGDLWRAFIERALGQPLEAFAPTFLTGEQVALALYPLAEQLRPQFLQAVPRYDDTFEGAADAAIESLADNPLEFWAELPAGTLRVLMERVLQGMGVAAANEAAGNPVMPVPPGLTPQQTTIAAALFLLHSMPLPWPVVERSSFELPPGCLPASPALH